MINLTLLASLLYGYRYVKSALVDVPIRSALNFVGNVVVTDDTINRVTTVNIGPAVDTKLSIANGTRHLTTAGATPTNDIFLALPADDTQDGLYVVTVRVAGTGTDFSTNAGLFQATGVLSVVDGVPTLLEAVTAATPIPSTTTLAAVLATDGTGNVYVTVTGIAATSIVWAYRYDVSRLVP